jgi:hypothetical protein
VSFNEHSQKYISEAYHEVPQQLTDYHESKRIKLIPQIIMTDEDLDILVPLVIGAIDDRDVIRGPSKKEDVSK